MNELGAAMGLEQALRVAPVAWTSKEFDAVIKAIVVSAERRLGTDGVAGLEAVLKSNSEVLRSVFTDISYERRYEQIGIGSYDATVSYGCLEISRSSFASTIRAPFSFAGQSCDSF